jgi:hypothetical protein
MHQSHFWVVANAFSNRQFEFMTFNQAQLWLICPAKMVVEGAHMDPFNDDFLTVQSHARRARVLFWRFG